ncbi:MAG: VanZ family protein [Microgenomates group bacterium]
MLKPSAKNIPSLKPNSILSNFSAFIPPIAWAALIFFLSSQQTLPAPSVTALDYLFKKSAHIFVYFVLCWLVQNSLHKVSSTMPSKIFATSFFICLLYALSDEYHQSFTPGRFASLYDVGYDMIGASLAIVVRSHMIKQS